MSQGFSPEWRSENTVSLNVLSLLKVIRGLSRQYGSCNAIASCMRPGQGPFVLELSAASEKSAETKSAESHRFWDHGKDDRSKRRTLKVVIEGTLCGNALVSVQKIISETCLGIVSQGCNSPRKSLPLYEMVKLFCYIQQISQSIFPIDIALGESIGDLKNAIQNANRVKLAAVDPDQLTLWKVCNFFYL